MSDMPHVFIYLDDILVASAKVKEHKEHLEMVLMWLQQHGLGLHFEKCVFSLPL